jgi:MFS family permease
VLAKRTYRADALLAVLLTGTFMANVDTAIVNVAAPSIQQGLQASGSELQFVVSGYTLANAMLLITAARLGDLYGYGRVFRLGLGILTLASLACGLAPSAPMLILARIVQGAGAALLVAQVLSGIQLNFAGAERARAIAAYAVALSAGAVAGQVLGGVLIAANLFGATWRPAFLINIPIGLGLLGAAARALPPHRVDRATRLDLKGVATLSLAVLLVVVPLVLGPAQQWPAWTWACLFGSLPAITAFVAVERQVERRGGAPLLNLHVLARRAVAWALVAASAALGTYFALLFVLALFLQQGLGKTPLYSGLALVSWVAAFGLSGPLLARVPLGRVPLFGAIGFLILSAAYLGIGVSVVVDQAADAPLMLLLGCGGLGLGLGRTAAVAHITNSVPDRYAADVSGLVNTSSQLAGVAGVAIFGTLYLSLAPRPGPGPAVPAFALVNAAFAVTTLLAAAAAYRSLRAC